MVSARETEANLRFQADDAHLKCLTAAGQSGPFLVFGVSRGPGLAEAAGQRRKRRIANISRREEEGGA